MRSWCARTGRRRCTADRAAGVVDVFVISETFTLSLLMALLLKGVLEVVVIAKKRVVTRFRQAPTGKVVWVVLLGSKFIVLETVALVFGPRVSLGGFFSVTALIVILMLSRAGVRRLLQGPRVYV